MLALYGNGGNVTRFNIVSTVCIAQVVPQLLKLFVEKDTETTAVHKVCIKLLYEGVHARRLDAVVQR